MNPYPFIFEFGLIFSFGISLVAGLFQFFNYRTSISRWSSCLLFGISIDLVCYFILYNNLLPEIGRFFVVLQVFGYLLLSFSLLVFILYFTGHSTWISNLSLVSMAIIPVIILILFVYQWETLPSSFGVPGYGFGVNTNIFLVPMGFPEALFLVFANLVGILVILMLMLMLFNTTTPYYKTIFALITGTLIIMAAGISEMLGANPFSDVSILQSAVALTTVPIILIIFTWKSVNSIPISQQLFKDSMRDGYIILDTRGKVVDYNQAVKRLLGEDVKLNIGSALVEVVPVIGTSLNQASGIASNRITPLLFERQGFISEITIYPVVGNRKDLAGQMVVFHNVTDRDQMEDTLRRNNVELSRVNTIFSAMVTLAVSIQTTSDTKIILNTLGKELLRLGLKCFVALYQPDSNDLKVMYISESIETIRAIEKLSGNKLLGFILDRLHFQPLYQILENQQIHFMPDEESAIKAFLGNYPGSVMDSLIKAAVVSKKEASMLIPLIAAEKAIGIMGVWGDSLREEDISPFRIFGSQIGWAIEKANMQEIDDRRLSELSNSNAMITALSRVSSLIEATSDNDTAFISLGTELVKIGLSCAIVTFDEQKTVATVRYVSFQTGTLEKVENIIGIKLVGQQIPEKFWPSKKASHEGIPLWLDNPVKILLDLFPGVPRGLSDRLVPMWKSVRTGKLCFVPLGVHGVIIGVMPIWGPNLKVEDDAALSIFGNQVAAILRRNISHENERRKSGEIARSNSMILALSGVASQLGNTNDLTQVLSTLGNELSVVNLRCMIGTLYDNQQMMKIEYLSIGVEIKKIAHKLGIPWPEELRIPRQLWPTDQAVIEKRPYWDPYPIGKASQMFPFIPKNLFNQAMKLAGLDLTEPVCYLPMICNEDVIGILAVWGKGLIHEDIPALSIFANQVATAIQNSWLFARAQNEIVERTLAEKQIREALSVKEILLKEVHHRVKNNLQVISSLLNLQAAELADPTTLNVLRESQNRVRSMALIHEKLYQSNDLANIDFSNYLQSLVYSLAQSYRVQAKKVDIQVQAERVFLDLDTAIPCGLIVNELVSNGIKYAFPGDRMGKIIVSLNQNFHNRFLLSVSDDGVGLPPGFDHSNSASLGLKLVNSLIRQIDAELSVDSAKGTRYDISFSKPETS